MAEGQLRSRGMTTGFETAPRDSESCNNNKELGCNIAENETLGNKEGNAQIEMQRGGEKQQSPDDQVNNPVKSNDNILMSSKQLERIMQSVREGFDNLRSEIHTDSTKLAENLNAKIQAEHSRLVEQIENNNKRLSETLTKQFREENEKLRADWLSKLEGEVTKFQKAMDKLRSDYAIEILSVSNSMESMCEKLYDRITGHIEETNRRVDIITEELKAKTKVLELDLGRHVENTDSDIQLLRQELIQVKKQINTNVFDKIAVCNSQIVAEKQEYQTKFMKVNQEIDKLKEKFSVKSIGDKTINNRELLIMIVQ
jgi:predicted HNH restriction endonuclease